MEETLLRMADNKDLSQEWSDTLTRDFSKFGKKEENGDLVIDDGIQKEIIHKKRENFIELPKIQLPKENRLISEFVLDIRPIIKKEKEIYFRISTNTIVEITTSKEKDSDEKKYLGFCELKPNRFITLCEKSFTPGYWIKEKDTGDFKFIKKSMGSELAKSVLDSPQLQDELPIIEKIHTFQIPILRKGNLTFPSKGYDNRFRSYLPEEAVKITDTEMKMEDAIKIIEELFEEFPFETPQDKTNAIAGLLTPFLRGLFSQPNVRTPIFLYEGNRERCGKDYVAGISQIVYDGYAYEDSPIKSDEELTKKIVGIFMEGKRAFHSSNNRGFLNSPALESLATTSYYHERALGKNINPNFPNTLDISLSGNSGLTYTSDFRNRAIKIKLFLDIENANERRFKNPNLHGKILKEREKILSALYTLVRDWFERGMKPGSLPFASFPEWANICGGIMENANLGNPCVIDEDFALVGGDTETQDMKRLFEICFEKMGNQWLKKSHILKILENSGEELFSYLDFDKRKDQTAFGMKLSKFSKRIFSDIKMILKDPKVKGDRREFMFLKEDVNLVNIVNLLPREKTADQKNIQGKIVNKVTEVNNFLPPNPPFPQEIEVKPPQEPILNQDFCDLCLIPTTHKVNGIPLCLECSKQVAKGLIKEETDK